MKTAYDKYVAIFGNPIVYYDIPKQKVIGSKFIFKYGKHKGRSLVEVLAIDKRYIKTIIESGDFAFAKKEEAILNKILYGKKSECDW